MLYVSRTAANIFRLFDGVDAEVGLQIEIQIQHVFGIAGFLRNQIEHVSADGIFGG